MNKKARPQMKEASDLFTLGRIVATPRVLRLLSRHNMSPMQLISRHVRGDWGCLDPEDVTANNEAVHGNERIFSNYPIAGDDHVWVITERDRSVTTLLLPCEY